MRKHLFLLFAGLSVPALVAGAFASGCGEVIEIDPGLDGGNGGDARRDGKHTTTVGPGGGDPGPDALPDYVDPGCPDAGPPVTDFECDPYKQGNGDCAPGEGCYIFVQYPTEPCGQETYGALCNAV